MPTLRPVEHLESVSRDYPGLWRQYASFLAQRRDLGDWPSWCYCPMAAAYAIVSGGGDNRVPLSRSLEISRVAALAAWRQTQGVYRFDPTLLAELLETPISGDLPVEHLQRLPEWCVYVELPSDETRGFFAHLEHDASDGHSELRMLLDTPGGLQPLGVHLGGTLESSAAAFLAHANRQAQGMPFSFPAGLIDAITRQAAPLISVLLYLCAGDAETRPTRDPKRTHEPARLRRGGDGQPYLPPAARPEVWETGFRLGAALRAAEARESGTGRSPRGHVRRSHWHGFWIGTGSERRLDVRWMPPIPVNLDAPDEPTVRRVRE